VFCFLPIVVSYQCLTRDIKETPIRQKRDIERAKKEQRKHAESTWKGQKMANQWGSSVLKMPLEKARQPGAADDLDLMTMGDILHYFRISRATWYRLKLSEHDELQPVVDFGRLRRWKRETVVAFGRKYLRSVL
jgi:hypothetical protein